MKFRSASTLLASGLFVFSVCTAADTAQVNTSKASESALTSASAANLPKTLPEKVSYTLGFDLGQSSKSQDMQIDANFVRQGIVDGQQDKPLMTDEEMRATMNEFKEQVMQKAMVEQKKMVEANSKESVAYLDKISKEPGVKEVEKGLYYKVLSAGKGPKPLESDVVEVNYEGTLPDGTKFDSSYDRKKSISFPLSQVIPGWTKTLVNMPVGSTWMIYIAPELGYGEFAPPAIGPNRALTFKVELLGIKKEEENPQTNTDDE